MASITVDTEQYRRAVLEASWSNILRADLARKGITVDPATGTGAMALAAFRSLTARPVPSPVPAMAPYDPTDS